MHRVAASASPQSPTGCDTPWTVVDAVDMEVLKVMVIRAGDELKEVNVVPSELTDTTAGVTGGGAGSSCGAGSGVGAGAAGVSVSAPSTVPSCVSLFVSGIGAGSSCTASATAPPWLSPRKSFKSSSVTLEP